MSSRDQLEGRFIVDGRPVIIQLINNPTIDDVVNAEARVHATAIEQGTDDSSRIVERKIRDFLIRLGVTQ